MKRYATIIQKFYRGYNHRKLLNIIYNKLPDDIQRKIIYFVREDLHYQKYINTLQKIINKKLYNWLMQHWSTGWHGLTINTIDEKLHLYNKYKSIIEDDIIDKMHILGKKMKTTIYNYTRLQDDPSFVNRSLNLLYYRIDYCLNNNTNLSSSS
tara:strand:+ start:3435 stop:3893 length:459 start_codon:yes stop_codon:yes gene_type:complete